jgi:membrane fusion protein (multidrug efflux system)
VIDGVKAGDQVIVEGVQKVRPGADVSPVPAKETKDAKDAPADKKQGAP